ncbi:MAG: hypothetical protein DSY50_08410 [Desulfobulbus sp.]|nr:MAG: hypothetical protein DSY50_08410 [Desulfobulbus sp.]
MYLHNNSTHFLLKVEGYEYENALEEDDANWLTVSIIAGDASNSSWRARNSCLRTFELVNLREWIQSILKFPLESTSIAFTENELSFSYDNNTLTVVLDFAFHPKKENYDYDVDEEYYLKFKTDKNILLKMLNYLNEIIQKYPVKTIKR